MLPGPVHAGDVVRVRSRVLEKAPHGPGRRGIVVWRVEVVNQLGRVVQSDVTLTLVEAGGAASPEARAA